MKIGIASDHRGFTLKSKIIENFKTCELIDYGTTNAESTDYPIYAFKIGEATKNKEIDYGILICGSGIGMSIACNKVKGVRCAKVENVNEVKYTRNDNDANVISFSENHSLEESLEMINTLITTPFCTEEKYVRRLNQIIDYEDKND